MDILLTFVLSLLAIFLILLVLVQRGRGGGLTGALGGAGGSSAFGAKAGDVFTRITIGAATGWIVICVLAAYWAGHRSDPLGGTADADVPNVPGLTAPLDTGSSDESSGESLGAAASEAPPANAAPSGDATAEEADKSGGANPVE